MNKKLEQFKQEDTYEAPSFSDLFSLGPVARISGAVTRWLSTTDWESTVDELLERSFIFEAGLADQIAEEKRRQQILREQNPLAYDDDSD